MVKAKNFITKHKAVLAWVVMSIVIILILDHQSKQRTEDLRNQTLQLREANVIACEKRGNPLRDQVNFQGNLNKTVYLGAYEQYKIERPAYAKFLRDNALKLKELPEVDCEEAYPK